MDYTIEKLMNVKVVLFGADGKGKHAFEYLVENGIHPLYFVDDNREIKNIRIIDSEQREREFAVYNPEVLFDEEKSNLAVVIAKNYSSYSGIKSRLAEMEVKYYFYSKDIISCDLLQHHLAFYNDKIGFCCGAHNKFHKSIPRFTYLNMAEETIVSMLQTREAILKGLNNIGDKEIAKPCADCCRLHTIRHHISDIGYGVEKFSLINISCYPSICQAECIFCNVPNNKNINNYKSALSSHYPKTIAEIILYLKKNNLLEDNCRFEFAPAEITITPFKDILFDATKGYCLTILTNGFIFDQQIANSLRENDSEVRLSLDSGTRETFKIVKKRDLFDEVVKNLINYRKHGRMELKYNILPGINDCDKNIDGMVNILKELNLEYVRLSFDYEIPLRSAFFGIVKFINALDKKNLSFCFHVYYTAEEIKHIIDEHWSAELESYYEEKSCDLSNFFKMNNDYNEYRNYVYETEIKDLITFLKEETRFSFLGNQKSSKNRRILSAFQKIDITPPCRSLTKCLKNLLISLITVQIYLLSLMTVNSLIQNLKNTLSKQKEHCTSKNIFIHWNQQDAI